MRTIVAILALALLSYVGVFCVMTEPKWVQVGFTGRSDIYVRTRVMKADEPGLRLLLTPAFMLSEWLPRERKRVRRTKPIASPARIPLTPPEDSRLREK